MEKKKHLVLLVIALGTLFVGGLFVVFAYTKEPYIVIQRILYSYTKNSVFSIQFVLKPNQVYDASILSAESNLPIYLNIVDAIDVNYRYRINDIKTSGVLLIIVSLKHPDGWSKKYLENKVNYNDNVSYKITLNIGDIVDYMEDICKHVGIKPTMFNISITSYVMSEIPLGTSVHTDNSTHTINLVVDLIRNRIGVSGPLAWTLPVEEKVEVYTIQTLFGLSIENLRTVSIFILSIGAILTSISTFVLFKTSGRSNKDMLKELESRYQNIIVSASRIPPLTEKNIVYLSKLEDIIKMSKLLEKPVIKYVEQTNNNQDVVSYIVFDKESVYIFRSTL